MDDLLLQKYLRNETSEEELVEVLDWLDASTENQRYLDRLDYISNLNILAGEAQPRIRRRTVSLWKRTAQWSAAAAAVLLACAGLGHYMADRILERRTRDMMAITAPNGQSMSVTLSDGTTVWLNSGAKLEYPSIFSRKTRRVKISGEAMFEVEHDASRPFIVETFACDAEVLGTKFNIEAYPDSETITTTLLEGSVEVESRLSRECIRMVPSQQLSYDIQSGEMKLSTISDSKEPVRWKDNVWVLHQTPFTQVCHRLEQMFNVKIVIMNDKFIGKKFTGEFRFGDSLESILEVIRITTPFTYEREEDTIILK